MFSIQKITKDYLVTIWSSADCLKPLVMFSELFSISISDGSPGFAGAESINRYFDGSAPTLCSLFRVNIRCAIRQEKFFDNILMSGNLVIRRNRTKIDKSEFQ